MNADDSTAERWVHEPVMVDEIVAVFATVPPGTVLDATLGGGGHSEALLDEYPALAVLGIDRDEHALAAAGNRLERFGDRVSTAHSRFDGIRDVMRDHDVDELSGALFDLGVSSPQLDVASEASATATTGPIDMRMDRTQPWSAADVVNGYEDDELARIIRRYGDERFASRIAKAIVAARPIETTAELAAIVAAAIPAAGSTHRRPPGQAHLPGDPHRGQQRARRPARRDRPGDRCHGADRPHRRPDVPLRRGPHRQGSLPGRQRSVRLSSRSAVRLRRGANGAPGPSTPHADGRPGRRQPARPVGSAPRRREGRPRDVATT